MIHFRYFITICALLVCIAPTFTVQANTHVKPKQPIFPSSFLGLPKGYHFNSIVWRDLTHPSDTQRYRDLHGIYLNRFPNLAMGQSGILIESHGHVWDFYSTPNMVGSKGHFEFVFTKPHAASILFISRPFHVPSDGSAIRIPLFINKKEQIAFIHWQHKTLALR
jgi:hypothetical protein